VEVDFKFIWYQLEDAKPVVKGLTDTISQNVRDMVESSPRASFS
jgi:hypothetical protein